MKADNEWLFEPVPRWAAVAAYAILAFLLAGILFMALTLPAETTISIPPRP